MKIKYITDPKAAREFIANELKKAHEENKKVAIDFETTSLYPDYDNLAQSKQQVRLSQFAWRPDLVYILDHFKCGSFGSFAEDIIRSGIYYCFNNEFEGKWLSAYCYEDNDLIDEIELYDVGHMYRSIVGGRPLNFAGLIKRLFDVELSKDQQASDWSAEELTSEQIEYAALDASWTHSAAVSISNDMTSGNWKGFHNINSSWRAFAEMHETGMTLDIKYHEGLVDMWERRRMVAYRYLRKHTPKKVIANLQSKKQLSDFLRTVLDSKTARAWPQTQKTGQLSTKREVLRGYSYISPYPFSRWLAALMVYTRAGHYVANYGEDLIGKQKMLGGIFGRFNAAYAVTGRISSSNPNKQSIPNSPYVRRSFIPPSNEHSLVIADYKGIELRVLAELSQDEQMKHDVIYGDMHAENAAVQNNIPREKYFALLESKDPRAKAMRTKAKIFSFQLTYGAGIPTLSIALRTTTDKASDFVDKWAERYPKAYGYRQIKFDEMRTTGKIKITSGRTIAVPRLDRTMPVASNYPIQGAAADVMYCALTRVEHTLRHSDIEAWMSATIHDEILLVASKDDAKRAEAALVEQMTLGWLDVFPNTDTHNLVDSDFGDSWAAKP